MIDDGIAIYLKDGKAVHVGVGVEGEVGICSLLLPKKWDVYKVKYYKAGLFKCVSCIASNIERTFGHFCRASLL